MAEFTETPMQEIAPGFTGEVQVKIDDTLEQDNQSKKRLMGWLFLLLCLFLVLLYFLTNSKPMVLRAPSGSITYDSQTFHINQSHQITTWHECSKGIAQISHCQLRFIHPEQTLELLWDTEKIDEILYQNLSNQFITVEKIEPVKMKKGFQITWTFRLSKLWSKTRDLDLAANVSAKNGTTYGWDDILDSNIQIK